MQASWYPQADRIDQRDDIALIGVSVSTMFLCDIPGILNPGIFHCNQFTIGGRSVFVCVPFAEVTNTDNSNLE